MVLKKKKSLISRFYLRKNYVFETPYYISIDGVEYDTIEIYITDDSFNPVSFDAEQVTCTLHFKQVL